jgi:hypothetical protein
MVSGNHGIDQRTVFLGPRNIYPQKLNMIMRAPLLLRQTLRRATPSTTIAAPIFQHHRTIHHHPHHPLPNNNNKKTTFGLALCSATLLGSCASNFASCAGPDDPSKAQLVKEMNASMDRIDRYLDAERAVEHLEQQVQDEQSSRVPDTEINRTEIPVALCQIHVGVNKATNLINARKAVQDAARKGARIISLPECFQCPYDTSCFPTYAEPIPDSADQIDVEQSPSTAMLLEVAKECNIYLVGGSIPERGADGNVYNTCVIVSPEGKILGKHRKMHLFDIDVPGKIFRAPALQHCKQNMRLMQGFWLLFLFCQSVPSFPSFPLFPSRQDYI